MAKIDLEGLNKLNSVRNALNVMNDTLEREGVYKLVKEEFSFIAGVVSEANDQWDRVGEFNESIPLVTVNGQEYEPVK